MVEWDGQQVGAARFYVVVIRVTLEDNVGEGNGNHSSILAWKIPWTVEPGSLQIGRAHV